MLSKKLAVLAATSLLFSSSVASAQTGAQALSLAKLPARASTSTAGKSKIHGATWLVAILALSAVVGGTIALTDKKDKPKSP